MMRSPQGGLRAGKDRRLLCAPVGEVTPQVGIPGLKSCRCGRVPHRWYEVSTWTDLANGEGSCPPLCGPDTEQ